MFHQHDFNKQLKNLLNEYNKQITAAILSMEDSDELTQIAKRYIPFTIGWLHSANKEGMAVAEGKPDILFSTSEFIKICPVNGMIYLILFSTLVLILRKHVLILERKLHL